MVGLTMVYQQKKSMSFSQNMVDTARCWCYPKSHTAISVMTARQMVLEQWRPWMDTNCCQHNTGSMKLFYTLCLWAQVCVFLIYLNSRL